MSDSITINKSLADTVTITTNGAHNWAIPGAIGSGTPNTGAFTTLTASGNVTVDTDTFFVNTTSNYVGIGTASPLVKLHIVLADDGLGIDNGANSTSGVSIENSTSCYMVFRRPNNTYGGFMFNEGTDSDGAQLRYLYNGSTTASQYEFRSNGAEVMRVSGDANVGINTGSFGTSSVGVIAIGNGTAPATNPAGVGFIHVVSGEVYVEDDAGNSTLISPHPENVPFPIPPNEDAYWVHDSVNHYTGKKVSIDVVGAIRAIETLSQQQFIYVQDVPEGSKRDWDENEQANYDARQAAIAEWDTVKSALEQWEGLSSRKQKKTEKPILPSPARPEPYTKKQPPEYIKRVLDRVSPL